MYKCICWIYTTSVNALQMHYDAPLKDNNNCCTHNAKMNLVVGCYYEKIKRVFYKKEIEL